MKYDESDNAFIRASRVLTDKVTDLLGEWAAPRPSPHPEPARGQSQALTALPARPSQGACSRRQRCQRCSQRSCVWTPPLTRTASCNSARTTSSPTSWRWVCAMSLPLHGHQPWLEPGSPAAQPIQSPVAWPSGTAGSAPNPTPQSTVSEPGCLL